MAAETLTAALLNTHVRDNENWLANDLPRCSAVRTVAQSIPNASLTLVSLTGTDEFDVGAMHDPVTNASRITVPSGGGGLYLIIAMQTYAASTGGPYDMNILKNGTAITGAGVTGELDTGGNAIATASILVPLVATDFIEIQTAQAQGSALNLVHARLQLIWQAF